VFKYYTNLLRESRFRTHIQKSLKDYSGNHLKQGYHIHVHCIMRLLLEYRKKDGV
jgi:hypothetical protein